MSEQAGRNKFQRMTKEELHDFVKWTFKHVNDKDWKNLSNMSIAKLYYQETGKYINRVTVGRNRDNWYMKGDKIIRYDG